jgi:hypothetical protein
VIVVSNQNEAPEPATTTQENVANDNAQVDLQIGVMHGDAYFYHTREDSPEENYRVGRNYLDSGAQRQAERLISAAFMSGHRTAEVAYYWSLAILSGRSFDHLEAQDLRCLGSAFQVSRTANGSAWHDALGVVARLVRCLYKHDTESERGTTEFSTEFTEALAEFGKLDTDRRAEIDRHLDSILAGGIQERLDVDQSEAVRANRLGNGRRHRAWKFFEPDPHQPELRRPAPVTIAVGDRVLAGLGGLMTTAGLTLLMLVVVTGEPIWTCLPLLIFAAGVSWATSVRWRDMHRARRLRARWAARLPVADGGGREDLDGQEHADDLRELVDLEFDFFRPWRREDRKTWDAVVDGIKNTLCRELIDTYEPDTPVQNVSWLIRWYARRTFAAWQMDDLPDYRDGLRKSPRDRTTFIVAVLLAGMGAVVELVSVFRLNWSLSLGAVALLAIGGAILMPAWTSIHLEWRRYFVEADEFAVRHDEQILAYRHMRRVLQNRPDDSEMTQWLEYDKAYVKMLAMREYRLTNRDVFAFATMSEARSGCRRARVLYGPPRYSTYLLSIFLLTTSGVRQITVELNFLTGEIRNERRMTFRYAAIASAWITEIGVRLDAPPAEADVGENPGGSSTPAITIARLANGRTLVISRAFKLSLVNNQLVRVNVETYDRGMMNLEHEDPWRLAELALDVSGITTALRFLEAVAAEGKDWVARESRRRARRMNSLFSTPDTEQPASFRGASSNSTSAHNGHSGTPAGRRNMHGNQSQAKRANPAPGEVGQ